jgi:hypothetical protein
MWFSAMLQVAVSVGSRGVQDLWSTVVVFECADDWDAAAEKARRLGESKEQEYLNGEGEAVAFRFVAVKTLDMLGDSITDGREVYFTRTDVTDWEQPAPHPPHQTGV